VIIHNGELFALDPRFEMQAAEVTREVQQRVSYGMQSDDRPTLITQMPLGGVGPAVMQVSGCIYRGESRWYSTWETIIEDLKLLESRQNVSVVAMLIDSAGGIAMGCEEACDFIDSMKKPVVAYVTGYACSAAYRLICHCDKIYATKSAQLGSIGTLLRIDDFSEAYKQAGIEVVAASTGSFKSFGQHGMPVTAEHRAFMQERVAVDQAGFVRSLTARGLSAEQQAVVSDCRYWSAPEALQLGLIDGIKSVTEVIEGAVSLVQSLEPVVSSEDDDDEVESEQLSAAGQLEGSDTMSKDVAGQPGADAGVKQGISTTEIKQLCPGATADFVLQQFEALQAEPNPSAQVKVLQSFQALQKAELEALKSNQSLAGVVGTDKVGSTQLTQAPAEGDAGKSLVGGVIQQFEGLVNEAIKAGMPRQQALRSVASENQQMHGQYIDALRKLTPQQVAARRAVNAGRVLSNDFSAA
jgi:signal peptide peptidase SppA